MADKIELRAAAARLLYNDQRDSADYGLLVDYIDQSVSVKHGRWRERMSTTSSVKCSVCNNYHEYETTFCPSCGARMDGDTE